MAKGLTVKMATDRDARLLSEAEKVLRLNDLGKWTRPTAKLYPHQWLWDSCFIAIGLRHLDVARAQSEIDSLLDAQWKSGMVPHVIFSKAKGYHAGPGLWQAEKNPDIPENISSTGITQPPLIAEAVVRIGEKLPLSERREWFARVFPKLARYHEWLYRERDPDGTGLVTLVHPWESGLDNSPPWMDMLHKHAVSRRLWLMRSLRLTTFIEQFRGDTAIVPASERMATLDLHAVYDLARQLRSLSYDDKRIFRHHRLLVTDVIFNSILIRANEHLSAIAGVIGQPLPPGVETARRRGAQVLEQLWDEDDRQYYSMDCRSKKLIKVSSIATLLPLYADGLPLERARHLAWHMSDPTAFAAEYPVPSAPLGSPYFKPHCYWQGPVWVNMNWLLIDGLQRNGYLQEAGSLRKSTLRLIGQQGMREYFSPIDGRGVGAPNFSWTAALAIDLIKQGGL